MKIAYVFEEGRLNRHERTRVGHLGSEFFYGSIQMAANGHDVALLELQTPSGRTRWWQRVVDRLFAWQLLPSRTTGAVLRVLKDISKDLNRCEVVVATTTQIAFGLGTLKLLNIVRPQIVAIHCGLINYRHSWIRRKVNGLILRRMWTQLYGDGEREGVIDIFTVPPERVLVNQFGVDVEFWTPDEGASEEHILSVGNDARRDYKLLLKAAAKISHPVVVVTARNMPGKLPQNVTIMSGNWHDETLTDEALRDLYRGAKCVVIPLVQSVQPSGQSVCLQAMACGKPVILTRTRGLWSESMMQDGENVIFVPPGDEEALVRAIDRLMSNPAERRRIGERARDTACSEGNIDGFADRLERLCKAAVTHAA